MDTLGIAAGVGVTVFGTGYGGRLAEDLTPALLRFLPSRAVGAFAAGAAGYLLGGMIGGNVGKGMQAGAWLGLIGIAADAVRQVDGADSGALGAGLGAVGMFNLAGGFVAPWGNPQ